MFRPRMLRALPRTLQPVRTPRRTLFSRQRSSPARPVERFNLGQLSEARTEYDRDRTYFLAAGAIAGIVSFVYTANKLRKALAVEKKRKAAAEGSEPPASEDHRSGIQLDASVPSETFTTEAGSKRKVVIHDEEGRELVPTGNKTVPNFPRTIAISPSNSSRDPEAAAQAPIAASVQDKDGVDYTLVGLGIRTVSFLSIQVYMVGYYVATQDVAKLQHYLTKKINPIATTLVPSERDELRQQLVDPVEGEQLWTTLLQEVGCRSAFRIVPVRDTDFPHLRDGFVRAITHRSSADKEAFGDDAFGESMKEFKRLFSRGKVPKSRELLLTRDEKGLLEVIFDDGRSFGRQSCGKVDDERVSRLLWLNWLAGSKVASEAARTSIIDGVMEFVERPVGTVAAQVV
ncbi:Altered inheritance of mitochondria protein 18 [Colletotrichum orbiculare MAFF 240422]|uniref:Altered inheritance of mitochondria protein 18 n=1 Tax=Colletotrichum orbiculare (strain 104-T / ATCC 96160 / CBS 514.97 / LARS 414 / MAFF 240422) TaxID=1213857 RepID=A0A484FEZ8_COLOR|nr:Altered inheritance of mitochondria protein 18 [Colletotrichum orbiculare MAFF 240422]